MRYIVALLSILLISCCEKEFVTLERVYQRDTTVYLPSAIIRDTLSFHDSTFVERIYWDSTGRAKLRIYQDAYNRVIAECEATRDTVFLQGLHTHSERIREVKVKEPMGFFERYGIYSFFIMVAIGLGGTIILILKVLK